MGFITDYNSCLSREPGYDNCLEVYAMFPKQFVEYFLFFIIIGELSSRHFLWQTWLETIRHQTEIHFQRNCSSCRVSVENYLHIWLNQNHCVIGNSIYPSYVLFHLFLPLGMGSTWAIWMFWLSYFVCFQPENVWLIKWNSYLCGLGQPHQSSNQKIVQVVTSQ